LSGCLVAVRSASLTGFNAERRQSFPPKLLENIMKMLVATVITAVSLLASAAHASPYNGSTSNANSPQWAQKAFSGLDK
jgi:hypothetical protein